MIAFIYGVRSSPTDLNTCTWRGLNVYVILNAFVYFQPMRRSQMLRGEQSMMHWGTVLSLTAKDREEMEVLLSSHLISILMTYLKTLASLVKAKILTPRSILRSISRPIRTPPVGRGIISRTFLLEADCLMTCLKTWRRCFLSVALMPPIGTRYRLRIGSMDPASTAGLSHSAEETWSRRTLTVPDSSLFFGFCQIQLVDSSSVPLRLNNFLWTVFDRCMISLNLSNLIWQLNTFRLLLTNIEQ